MFGSKIHVVNYVKPLFIINIDTKGLGEFMEFLLSKLLDQKREFSLDQSHYIEKISRKYNYYDRKLASMPYDPIQV